MRNDGVSVTRLNKMLERQEPPKFGAAYLPATFATREEAPGISCPAILQCKKLAREIHMLGQPEVNAGLLALHHPFLTELHEQKILCCWPHSHPISGLPGIDATSLASLRGTVEVAERLGYLFLHPVIYIPDPESPGRKLKVPFPYQGDLLLFMRRDDGSIYCVNWTIKNKRAAFFESGPGKRDTKETRLAAQARLEIEIAYYLDAYIRTQMIADEDIDSNVSANLCQLYPYTYKTASVEAAQRQDIVEAYKAALVSGLPPMDVMTTLITRGKCTAYDARVIFYQSIWERELRVDLFQPVLVDYPLQPESVDILNRYAGWFLP